MKTSELMNAHPTEKHTHFCAPLLYLLLLLHSAPSSPLSLPPLPPSLLPISRYVVSWVCLVARLKITDPFSAWIPFFTWLSTPPAVPPDQAECVFMHTQIRTLFDLTASTECISPLPFSISSQARLCSDLFQCVVASRVCVRPCPVKYRLFKEVSNIIWPLYCNYKVLILEMWRTERAAHRHLLSPCLNAIFCRYSCLIHPWILPCFCWPRCFHIM